MRSEAADQPLVREREEGDTPGAIAAPPGPPPAPPARRLFRADWRLTRDLFELARPHHWAKGAFVIVGPVYGMAIGSLAQIVAVGGAFTAFGFASSACYVANDVRDLEADRAHPRKRNRPVAAGRISTDTAFVFAIALLGASAAAVLLPLFGAGGLRGAGGLAVILALYVLNTTLYSIRLKHIIILDVMSLALGFVLRVIGGCAAVNVTPSPWLLNSTFFLSMFLAFGKRLGERRTMGTDAAAARVVQQVYTDDLLRMTVVVTGVACLLTYAGYVQAHTTGALFSSILWLTMLPATYGLLRCIVLLEHGRYDDPTELAVRDRPFQAALLLFGGLTAAVMFLEGPLAAKPG